MRLLDLFCGAGGASMGYHRAGFDVVGIDINPQPRYPFPFIQADALKPPFGISDFDVIHASPPCQHYTRMLNHGLTSRVNHPDLIQKVRTMLLLANRPFVIENVEGSPLVDPITLCGEYFGLRVIRHRLFECSKNLEQPTHKPHHPAGGIRSQGDGGYYYRVYGHETGKASWGKAMGIDWMRSKELAQSIPPAYTEFIGRQLIRSKPKGRMSR
jgi:DNA (cytosine-5)-methyltransferase 1